MPGHGRPRSFATTARSPHGTSTCRSASHRPPPIAGVSTPRCPSIACTRESAWCTFSSGPPPKIAGRCVDASATAAGSIRTCAIPLRSTPCPCASLSCQRTRSTTAAASNEAGCSHTRSERSPRSAVSSTRSSVHTSCSAPSRVMNASAAMRMPKATCSAISSGGSNATSRCNSGGGVRGSIARESCPAARSCRRMPRSPNRSCTRSASRRAKSPRLCTPSRVSSSISSGAAENPASASTATGNGARNAGASPAGTTATWAWSWPSTPLRAACSAVKGPSAMPARTPSMPCAASTWMSSIAASVSPP